MCNGCLVNNDISYNMIENNEILIVKLNNSYYNIMGRDGSLRSREDFCKIEEFKDGIARVTDKDCFVNFLRIDGSLVSNERFLEAFDF